MSSTRPPIKPALKFLFIFVAVLIVVGILYGVANYTSIGKSMMASSDSNTAQAPSSGSGGFFSKLTSGKTTGINVCVNTWGGYAGGLLMNGGLKPNPSSRFTKDYNLNVEMKLIDDFDGSRNAWKNNECDLLWITADSFPTEVNDLMSYRPKIFMQFDWSNGGDVAVGTANIKSVADLRGKKIAYAQNSPSETLLYAILEAGNLTYKDVQLVPTKSAPAAADAFKTHNVDVAIMWSPDDEACLKAVSGSHVLKSTREASNLIADVFYVKQDYLNAHGEELKALATAWLTGNAEVNADKNGAKAQAAQIMATAFNVSPEDAAAMIKNARLATFGDNLNFFGRNSGYNGITGDELYSKMVNNYKNAGAITGAPSWREITDTSIITSLKLQPTDMNAPEPVAVFSAPAPAVVKAPAFSSKPVTVNFAYNSSVLDENAKAAIDKDFLAIAKQWRDNRIRIEGNTDNQGGNSPFNQKLSEARAQAVVDYLVNDKGFNRNRFIVKGNGAGKPIPGVDPNSESGRAQNRRTEFQLLNVNE